MTMRAAMLALCAMLLSGNASGGDSTRAKVTAGQQPQKFTRTIRTEVGAQFLLYLPAGFESRTRGYKYPLLLFMHGSGESGTDLDKVRVHGPPKFLPDDPDFPFIVASPQSPHDVRGGGFDPLMLDALIDELIARLPIDTDRIYLTGLSMGGMASYNLATLRPQRFAAIAPVCGLWNPADACRVRDVPVWAFHGDQDDVVPIDADRAMIDAIKTCGGDARLTVYEGVGHDAWNPAYAERSLYTWLLQQRRGAKRADDASHVVAPGALPRRAQWRATSSATTAAAMMPAFAIDRDPATKWSGSFAPGDWLQVDLGANADLGGVQIRWGSGFAISYLVQYSADGETWLTALDARDGSGGEEYRFFPAVNARYLRLAAEAGTSETNVSIAEFEPIPSAESARIAGIDASARDAAALWLDGSPPRTMTRPGKHAGERVLEIELPRALDLVGLEVSWAAPRRAARLEGRRPDGVWIPLAEESATTRDRSTLTARVPKILAAVRLTVMVETGSAPAVKRLRLLGATGVQR